MKDKRFEHRYVTLKVEDIKHFLTRDEQESLEDMCNKIAVCRKAAGRKELEGIFICNDWPEYNSAAFSLYTRISGNQQLTYKGHSNLADMMSTHVDSLINILERVAAEDVEEDTGYLHHEIRALRDIKAAIEAEKSQCPTK